MTERNRSAIPPSPRENSCGGKTRSVPVPLAAVCAGAAANCRLAGIFFLAGNPGALLVAIAAGRFCVEVAVRLVRQFHRIVRRPDVFRFVQDHRTVFPSGGGNRVVRRLIARGIRQRRGARRDALQDPAHLALRGRTGGSRRTMAVSALACDRHRHLPIARGRSQLELLRQRRSGASAHRGCRCVEADQLQLSVFPRRPAVDSAVSDRGGGASTAPGL